MPTIVMHWFDRCSDESAELEALSNIVASFESFCLASCLEALRETRAPGGPLMKCPARPSGGPGFRFRMAGQQKRTLGDSRTGLASLSANRPSWLIAGARNVLRVASGLGPLGEA